MSDDFQWEPYPGIVPSADQSAGPVCRHCQGAIGTDGYCLACGLPGDRVEISVSEALAGVSDRGLRHLRNDDAFAVGRTAHGDAILVVCDGVSTAPGSDVAAAAAARTALTKLESRGADEPARALRSAVEAANEAVTATASDATSNPPSSTFVAAVLAGRTVHHACLGDSRLYWLPDEGEAKQLTQDDSMAQERMNWGIPREVAEAAPDSHMLTRWLGRDAGEVAAEPASVELSGSGWLLACTDGLWNYASTPEHLGGVVKHLAGVVGDATGPAGGFDATARVSALQLARLLVDWANACGGRDNVTVALARVTALVSGA